MPISPITFRRIVSGERRDPLAHVARGLFALAEPAYRRVIQRRNRAYDNRRASIERLPVPVVSVGNLTLGGTGKTPMVAWIAQQLLQDGIRVGLVSRGYGSRNGMPNDEAAELALRLPNVPHVQHPDRARAARQCLEQGRCDALVLDDGFQHRRLARDLDIVLIDATDPFGCNHVFPRGLLREPPEQLARADAVVLTRADQVTAAVRESILARVRQLAPQAILAEVAFRPMQLINARADRLPADHWAGAHVLAFCGIGNPDGFAKTLASLDVHTEALRTFADHYRYNDHDIRQLADWTADHPDAAAVLCTVKDLVKLPVEQLGATPLWAVQVEAEFLRGRDLLTLKLRQLTSSNHPRTADDATS